MALSWGVAETDPDSSTTGAWSKPFSRRIWMVCSQVTVGSTVSGADRFSSWTLWCHHLREEGAGTAVSRAAGVQNTRSQRAAAHRETTGRQPSVGRHGWPGQPHQGFFTARSSFRKPFWSIHLSLRNLDLRASGGRQGQRKGVSTACAHTKGLASRSPVPPPDPAGPAQTPCLQLQGQAGKDPMGLRVAGAPAHQGRRKGLRAQVLPGALLSAPLRLPG